MVEVLPTNLEVWLGGPNCVIHVDDTTRQLLPLHESIHQTLVFYTRSRSYVPNALKAGDQNGSTQERQLLIEV